MAKYKRQHYIPKSYLKRFCVKNDGDKIEPYLWIFDKKNEDHFKRSPKKIAFKSYYYSYKDEKGETNYDIEKYLSDIESKASPIIQKMDEGAITTDLTSEERAYFSIFVAFMGHRVPHFRTHWEKQMADLMKTVGMVGANNRAYFNSLMTKLIDSGEISPDTDIEAVRQFALSGEYKVIADPLISLQVMADMTGIVCGEIYNFNWRILRANDENSFVTSDDPLVLVTTMKLPNLYGSSVGWYSPYMEATFPLSTNSTLLISQHHPEGEETVSSDVVKEINMRTATHCDRQLYSNRSVDMGEFKIPSDWIWWKPLSSEILDEFMA